MVDALVDTSIVIDLIRGFHDAVYWLESTNNELGVTYYVWLEIIEVAPDKRKLKDAMEILSDFELVDTKDLDIKWAVEELSRVSLSHNVDAMDALIASTAHRLNIPLYARNLKHFKPLLGDLAQKPYRVERLTRQVNL